MVPFENFRHWAAHAPGRERLQSALAALIAVALLAWLLVPDDDDPATEVTYEGSGDAVAESTRAGEDAGPERPAAPVNGGRAGSPDAGSAEAGSPDGAAGADTPGAPTASAAGGGSTAAPGACASPPGSARGVTADEIRISITLVEVVGPAANSAFGFSSPSEQQENFEAVIDDVNRNGGIACRTVAPRFYKVNPADQSDLQQKCLDIAEAGVYANLDLGYSQFPQKVCFAQHRIPFFGSYVTPQSELERWHPYLFDFENLDQLYRNAVFGLKERGYFDASNGFDKLGFVYKSCFADTLRSLRRWLEEAGMTDARLVTYDLGCPAAFATPSDLAQAILKFRQNGVTHVLPFDVVGDFGRFTRIAEQQGFRPKYGIGDQAMIQLTYSSSGGDPNNIAGAIAITGRRSGEERTPDVTPSPGTARCNAILEAHGRPSTYEQDYFAGHACNVLWMFRAAVQSAPDIRPESLATGVARAKSVEFSYPDGPNEFTGRRVTHGGQYWRAAEFRPGCKCWQLLHRDFRRGFG